MAPAKRKRAAVATPGSRRKVVRTRTRNQREEAEARDEGAATENVQDTLGTSDQSMASVEVEEQTGHGEEEASIADGTVVQGTEDQVVNVVNREGQKTAESQTEDATTTLDKVKNQEYELDAGQKSTLGGEYISKLFHDHKFMTTAMIESNIGAKILKGAYEQLRLQSTEQKQKKKRAIIRHIKQKFNRCKDYFVDCIKRTVISEKGR